MSSEIDQEVLGFTVIALSIALEETLKVLADKNGGHWRERLDEAQDLALLRARAHLSERAGPGGVDTTRAALAIAEHIFAKMRSSLSSSPVNS
jgi:hypothetical protein